MREIFTPVSAAMFKSRAAATSISKCAKSSNPFMNGEKAAAIVVNECKDVYKAAECTPAMTNDSDLYITSFFGMSWGRQSSAECRKMDQMLIKNVRILMEEERDRQRDFERLCQARFSY
ncbi:unnamed protein product [Heligmosomoides polygyrus]|uniref:DUF19 domain-containing protein n=1 Tax=Heligmosomoides polygyrus TaxID=6339 RepID=A0A183FZ79_HELPZ|nr:unnamed protein product [Heligmosomoides polygyrus]